VTQAIESASRWMYRGVWAVLVNLMRVPRSAPNLPVTAPCDVVESFRPAQGYLNYLKFWFWLLLWPMDVAILIGMILLCIFAPLIAMILLIPAIILAVLPDIVAYIALHLRYDTMWYVMSSRSVRIHRGIWVIHEMTITFENVQNVRIESGPVQRYFGIANLIIETAGGGSESNKPGASVSHRGIIEGIAHAEQLRDQILMRLRQSHSAGLGDEQSFPAAHGNFGTGESAGGGAHAGGAWMPAHVQTLREIRDLLRGGLPA
jgi:membrane protein YdbS with pleckstrin-like domain